ncbi:MAG: DUF454 family protein [Spirochaetota bacterium]
MQAGLIERSRMANRDQGTRESGWCQSRWGRSQDGARERRRCPREPFCPFARSSPRLHAWLLADRVFGAHIRNCREHHGTTRRHKVVTVRFLALETAPAAKR